MEFTDMFKLWDNCEEVLENMKVYIKQNILLCVKYQLKECKNRMSNTLISLNTADYVSYLYFV